MKIKKKTSLQKFLPLSEAEIQGLQGSLEFFFCVVSVSPAALNEI
jgi:hypothetical protein